MNPCQEGVKRQNLYNNKSLEVRVHIHQDGASIDDWSFIALMSGPPDRPSQRNLRKAEERTKMASELIRWRTSPSASSCAVS
jgi:hypothetical protein